MIAGDKKHEDKKPETARPIEVIGEHQTEPTTAPTTAHPASFRPGAGAVHFDCVEPYVCSCTSYRVHPGTIGGCNRCDHADARRARRLPRLRHQAERQQQELTDEA